LELKRSKKGGMDQPRHLHEHFRTHYGGDAHFSRPSTEHGRPSPTNHHGPEGSKKWGYVV